MGSGISLEINLDDVQSRFVVDTGENQKRCISHSISLRTAAQAGTALKGKVVLQVTKTAYCNKVLLKMYGKEKTVIPKTKNKNVDPKAERQFFLVTMDLQHNQWKRSINPGTYVIPFTINLPASLPASSYHKKSRSNGYRIQYKLVATIAAGLIPAKAMCYIQMLSAPLPDERAPCFIKPTSYELNSMKFLKKGNVTFGACIDDTHVGKGEEISLHIACRNESTATVKRVQVSLIEQLFWTVAPGSTGKYVERFTEYVLFTIPDIEIPGLNRSCKGRAEVRRSLDDPMSQQETYRAIHDDLRSGNNRVGIRIPLSIRDSYQGHLVRISHYLKIKIRTKMSVTNPTISIPLRIGNAPSRTRESLSGPSPVNVQPTYEPEIAVYPQQENVPLVSAVPIPSGAMHASMTTASESVIILGGEAVQVEDDQRLADLIPVPPPTQNEVSLESLVREMASSVNDYDIIARHLREPSWKQFLQNLSPDDFGTIISYVNVDFEQPRVAVLLANDMRLSGAHLISALRNTSHWNRAHMVQRLLPFCVDLNTSYNLIQQELNEWEQTVTTSDFEIALRA